MTRKALECGCGKGGELQQFSCCCNSDAIMKTTYERARRYNTVTGCRSLIQQLPFPTLAMVQILLDKTSVLRIQITSAQRSPFEFPLSGEHLH